MISSLSLDILNSCYFNRFQLLSRGTFEPVSQFESRSRFLSTYQFYFIWEYKLEKKKNLILFLFSPSNPYFRIQCPVFVCLHAFHFYIFTAVLRSMLTSRMYVCYHHGDKTSIFFIAHLYLCSDLVNCSLPAQM